MAGGAEIERKYLLSTLPEVLLGGDSRRIEQGYLPSGSELTVRLRRVDGSKTLMTIKSGAGLVRAEEEFPIPAASFERLWPLTEGARVNKTRQELPLDDGLVAEVDVYADHLTGLLTVEVEFPDEASAGTFSPPDWFGTDVTGDPAYSNRALAG
jgi:adenylate cyclase